MQANRLCLLATASIPFIAGAPFSSPAADFPPPVIISEVMSSASTYYQGTNLVPRGSDFFRLCNLGTTDQNLTGWRFTDHTDSAPVPIGPSGSPLILAPGESVVIFMIRSNNTTSEAQFRNWWGPCLPGDMQVYSWDNAIDGVAFSRDGDGINLYDRQSRLVDRVYFGTALPGYTFICDTNGQFGEYNWRDRPCTCQAQTADDFASFCSESPIPLQIIDQPLDQSPCAGSRVIFTIIAAGLPRPHFTWYLNGNVIQEGMSPTFTNNNSWPTNSGTYQVELNNGRQIIRSQPWIVTVNTNSTPPVILTPPSDCWVFMNQNARYTIEICAFPVPYFQWFSNGVPILGATNASLALSNCHLSMSDAVYSVLITNTLGTTSACARLTVTRKPDIRLTELQPYPNPTCHDHKNWFELSNYETNWTINLRTWRFLDQTNLGNAFVITQDILLRPYESAIFVQRMTPREFRDWWGDDNLPITMPICTFYGFSFNPGGEDFGGDEFYLWNQGAEKNTDTVISRSFASCRMGVSLQFTTNLLTRTNCFYGCDSQLGDPGIFPASECGDIGSPGYFDNSPPRIISMAPDASAITFKFWAVEGKTFNFYSMENIGRGGTSFVQNIWGRQNSGFRETNAITATNWVHTLRLPSPATNRTSFYFLQEMP